ncbi:dephospho-CoA kinase [Lewinella aquimaris]|uniref:Dephospho-CoA kinase n=1 Tax=Neolewinella aquimaris TaxID=1835722 RepID=A0A840EAV6_9BACT|nr:dephospho-CoA kinase [Neolewinella aquimaris]MBB4078126.1 dephospho-CoA kinase [Neolewinella aquimaris]
MGAKRIGITGNIGAGKTTVCREFERLGVPVYYADARAKVLMVDDPLLRGSIAERFGANSYTPEGQLNRSHLADRVFGDAAALAALNELVHPAVARDAAAWHTQQTHPYTLHEAAILYEIGAAGAYDGIIVVACPQEIRFDRVMGRDGVDRSAVESRAARQWSDEEKEAAADYVIRNDGQRLILPQVLRVDRLIREGATTN